MNGVAPRPSRTFERLDCWLEFIGISFGEISVTQGDSVMEELKGKEKTVRRSGEKHEKQLSRP